MSINFHIGFSGPKAALFLSAEQIMLRLDQVDSNRRSKATGTTAGMLSQGEILATLLTSEICERFPTLKLVSVESGFGYVPYLIESLDWHWKANGAHLHSPTLPSEHFKRQCYGTFWFEQTTLRLLDLYPDNFMFSTDYPHPTSVSPGPASPADIPAEHVRKGFSDLPGEIARKALWENAKAIYKLRTPAKVGGSRS